jgi:hypothetical protein
MYHTGFPVSPTGWRLPVWSPPGGCFWGSRFALISAFSSIAFQPFDGVGVDPFEQHEQIAALNLDWLVLPVNEADIGEAKRADFQSFSKDGDAIDVPPQQLDEVAALASKQEEVSAHRLCVATHSRCYVANRDMWRPTAST